MMSDALLPFVEIWQRFSVSELSPVQEESLRMHQYTASGENVDQIQPGA